MESTWSKPDIWTPAYVYCIYIPTIISVIDPLKICHQHQNVRGVTSWGVVMRKLDSKVNNKAKIMQYQNHLWKSLTLSITVRRFKRLTSPQSLSLREAPSCLRKQIPSFHLTLAPMHILTKQGDDSRNWFFFCFPVGWFLGSCLPLPTQMPNAWYFGVSMSQIYPGSRIAPPLLSPLQRTSVFSHLQIHPPLHNPGWYFMMANQEPPPAQFTQSSHGTLQNFHFEHSLL